MTTSPATAALGTQEGEPLLNELVRLRRDVARITELQAHIRELENLTASHARTIDALRAALHKITLTPSMPFPDAGAHSYRAWGSAVWHAWSAIQEIAARALKEHPNG